MWRSTQTRARTNGDDELVNTVNSRAPITDVWCACIESVFKILLRRNLMHVANHETFYFGKSIISRSLDHNPVHDLNKIIM